MTTLQKLEELIYKGFKETDERFKESERLWKQTWKETDKRIDKVSRQIGGITDSLSRFSEQTVLPAIRVLFNERDIELNRFYTNMEAHLNGDNMETDIIGLGPECTVLIEVKLRLRQKDVEEFLEKKLPRFFDFFPSFRQPRLYGGVAGMSIDSGVDRFAYKKGLFVIGQTGDNLRILNDKKFRPRSFAIAKPTRPFKRKTK